MAGLLSFDQATVCTFKGCDRRAPPGSDKCTGHRARKQCRVTGCANVVYARQLCVRHGGKKQCQYAGGCQSSAQGGNLCAAHGGEIIKRFCRIDGCARQAHAKRLCVHHGGGRLCQVTGCAHHARVGGFCHKHKQSTASDDEIRPALYIHSPWASSPSSPINATATTKSTSTTAAAQDTDPSHSFLTAPHAGHSSMQQQARVVPTSLVPSAAYSEWWALTQCILQEQYPWLKEQNSVVDGLVSSATPPPLDPHVCVQLTQAVLMTPAIRGLLQQRFPASKLTEATAQQIDHDIASLASLFADLPPAADSTPITLPPIVSSSDKPALFRRRSSNSLSHILDSLPPPPSSPSSNDILHDDFTLC